MNLSRLHSAYQRRSRSTKAILLILGLDTVASFLIFRYTHHIVLVVQDDVEVSRNLAAVVEKVASEVPTVLFLARLPSRISKMALRATKKGERYVTARLAGNEFCPVVGILWPVGKAQEFLQWTHDNPHRLGHQRPRSDDGVLGKWAAFTKQDIRFTVPSLVEHPDREPSLIGKKALVGQGQRALRAVVCRRRFSVRVVAHPTSYAMMLCKH